MNTASYRRFYDGVILPILWGGSRVLALANKKVCAGLSGRRGLVDRVRRFREQSGTRPVLLFHCASAGELEALKPIAAEFDRERIVLAVSYFSPSAQTALRDGSEFDFADYSPIDSARLVRSYLDAIRPSVIAITKHDVWPNFAWASHDLGIPLLLINGNFHAKSARLWPGARGFHAAVYSAFREVMAVSDEDAERARRIVGDGVKVVAVGDARFDRVMTRVQQKRTLPAEVTASCAGRWVIVAGSTHTDDEELLLPLMPKLSAFDSNVLLLVVPHDPSSQARRRIEAQCRLNGIRFHNIERGTASPDVQVVLVNRSGILADLYRQGHVAYVGGGYGRGVHSVLEPMASGLPVLCGPNIAVSNEAREASAVEIVHVVTGRRQAERWIADLIADANRLNLLGTRAVQFVESRTGVARQIADRLKEYLGE